jgi:hypothetical protein
VQARSPAVYDGAAGWTRGPGSGEDSIAVGAYGRWYEPESDQTRARRPALLTGRKPAADADSARFAALDGGALGVMAVDAGVAAIIIGARGAHELWIVALVLLGLSLGVAVRTLRLPGAEQTGPSVAAMREAREGKDDNELEELVLEDLARDVEINDQALVRKGPLFDRALTFLVLAILVELAGRAVQ